MKNFILKVKTFIVAHKIISIFLLLVIILAGYWNYKRTTGTTGETRYVLSKVTKGTIISSITGSGQVSASNQIDIKPNVSGVITYVGIKPGDRVGSGQLLFSIDDTTAQKAVRDAQVNLDSAQIVLSKLNIQNSNENMNASLTKAYDDAFNTVSNVFLDLPGIVNGLNDMFFKGTISTNGQWNVDWYEGQVVPEDIDAVKPYKKSFVDSFNLAFKAYTDSSSSYKSASRTSDNATIEALISQTYNTVKEISDAIKNANNYIDFVNGSILKRNTSTPPAIIAANKATLNDYTSKTNAHLTDLLSAQTTIKGDKDAFPNAGLDQQSQELGIKQKENALSDAKDNLLDYSIRSPFGGTITAVPVQKGDNAGSGTTLGTLITAQSIATVSLNEVDIAKILLGQKATLTFDAVPDLTITGKVVQIDSVGTVSQGVVDYNVKISFDTNDGRIKPGMSVSASIITGIKQNVLTVPNSAVKNQNGSTYVQIFDTALPAPLPGVQGSPSAIAPSDLSVVIGATNDTTSEIISGLNEGDEIVSRTIAPTTSSTTAPSILGATGQRGNAGGGGAVRIPTGR